LAFVYLHSEKLYTNAEAASPNLAPVPQFDISHETDLALSGHRRNADTIAFAITTTFGFSGGCAARAASS
jgi:hypothetical protein